MYINLVSIECPGIDDILDILQSSALLCERKVNTFEPCYTVSRLIDHMYSHLNKATREASHDWWNSPGLINYYTRVTQQLEELYNDLDNEGYPEIFLLDGKASIVNKHYEIIKNLVI